MNIYMVEYDGLWMGGVAIVAAESEEDALAKVEIHARTINFHSEVMKAKATLLDPECGGVFYNDNGDY